MVFHAGNGCRMHVYTYIYMYRGSTESTKYTSIMFLPFKFPFKSIVATVATVATTTTLTTT